MQLSKYNIDDNIKCSEIGKLITGNTAILLLCFHVWLIASFPRDSTWSPSVTDGNGFWKCLLWLVNKKHPTAFPKMHGVQGQPVEQEESLVEIPPGCWHRREIFRRGDPCAWMLLICFDKYSGKQHCPACGDKTCLTLTMGVLRLWYF